MIVFELQKYSFIQKLITSPSFRQYISYISLPCQGLAPAVLQPPLAAGYRVAVVTTATLQPGWPSYPALQARVPLFTHF